MDIRPKLSIVRGGEVIVTIVGQDPNDPNPLTGEEKFNTCQFKSKEERVDQIRSCCGVRETRGMVCEKLNIFPLNSAQCTACKEYQRKQN